MVNPDKVPKAVLREDHSVDQKVVKAKERADHREVTKVEKALPPIKVTKGATRASVVPWAVVVIVAVIWDLLPGVAKVACKLALSIY
ncbi:MAG: hypothetical protein NVSMB67_25870 [Flavisolibacter sp.]